MTQEKATAITFYVLMGHVSTLENAVWSCGTDEYKDGVSDTAVNKRAALASSARAKVREVVETLVNERNALLSEVAELKSLLKPIIDCYGLGLTAEKFTDQVGPFILDARALLGKER